MKVLLQITLFLIAIQAFAQSQPKSVQDVTDTSGFFGFMKPDTPFYSRTSVASDPIKQFKEGDMVPVISYVKDAVEYLYVLEESKFGYVALSDIDIDSTLLEYLKLKGKDGESARIENAYKSGKIIKKMRADDQLDRNKSLALITQKGLLLKQWNYTEPGDLLGEVEVSFEILNPVKKKIKYAWFTVVAYNAVGDRTGDRIRGTTPATLKGVGPVGQWDEATWTFDHVWYNETIDCVKITQIKIQYMDGSVRLFDKPNLVLANGLTNSCKY